MRSLTPIDMHAHIEPSIAAADLVDLQSLVFAATRSLDEAELALRRSDSWTIWGVGCHPGLVGVQKSFDSDRFTALISHTAYVSEIGLDGTSRVPLATQRATFEAILKTLDANQRLAAVHSFNATETVLDCLTAQPICGVVLHWWLGDIEQTRRAVELGCHFSINASMLRRPDLLEVVPLDRVLTETDHPFGDRSVRHGRRPGNIVGVEDVIACIHGLSSDEVRRVVWRNLAALVSSTRCGMLLPRPVRVTLAAID